MTLDIGEERAHGRTRVAPRRSTPDTLASRDALAYDYEVWLQARLVARLHPPVERNLPRRHPGQLYMIHHYGYRLQTVAN